ncbi:MAG TPA: cysteine desulfurase family protein [Kribbellaceae bacterium]|nr:cysteine desulfurase family protein [Kribbellaceae bacterium]
MPATHPGLTPGVVYLDYNATTPVDPRVVEAMLPYLTVHFGNPSSAHDYATVPLQGLAAARQQVAALIGAQPEQIVFTGSGSEADALAIRGAVLAANTTSPPAHVVTQATEHPAVLAACRALQREHGTDITVLPVDDNGLLDPARLQAALTPRTALVSVMYANNETGTVQPIAELAALTRRHGALFHTDAAQAVGKIPVDVKTLGVDLLTVVGHKMYAPKGIAALYIRTGVRLSPLVGGGGQERGLRAGTENIAGAVALGAAAELAGEELADGTPARLRELRDRLHETLAQQLPGRVRLNGHPVRRLPNTLNISIAGTRGRELLADCPAVAASTGAACHAGTVEPSPVLRAMKVTDDVALAAIRLSLGRWTTDAEVDRAAAALSAAASTDTNPPADLPAAQPLAASTDAK